jgi:hypothetical protein
MYYWFRRCGLSPRSYDFDDAGARASLEKCGSFQGACECSPALHLLGVGLGNVRRHIAEIYVAESRTAPSLLGTHWAAAAWRPISCPGSIRMISSNIVITFLAALLSRS